jgi:hypothetical protein
MNLALLREHLIQAVEDVLRDFEGTEPAEPSLRPIHHLEVRVEPAEQFSFRWPEVIVEYQTVTRVHINDGSSEYPFVIGWEPRPAYGKEDRGRWVVFSEYYGASSLYPVIEFTETDEGHYSAVIPREGAGKRLKDGDELPAWFDSAVVERTDVLFDSVRNGPSLRVVVAADDFVAMALHGYWSGAVRHRLPGPVPTQQPSVSLISAVHE